MTWCNLLEYEAAWRSPDWGNKQGLNFDSLSCSCPGKINCVKMFPCTSYLPSHLNHGFSSHPSSWWPHNGQSLWPVLSGPCMRNQTLFFSCECGHVSVKVFLGSKQFYVLCRNSIRIEQSITSLWTWGNNLTWIWKSPGVCLCLSEFTLS